MTKMSSEMIIIISIFSGLGAFVIYKGLNQQSLDNVVVKTIDEGISNIGKQTNSIINDVSSSFTPPSKGGSRRKINRKGTKKRKN